MSNSSKGKKKVEVIHRINRLKMKAGADANDKSTGFIDPKAIRKAQAAIDEQESEYHNELEEILTKLDSVWTDLKARKAGDKKIAPEIDKLFNYANNVKDLAETYSYELMRHFGQSLRDFCDKFDIEKPPHHIIMQAHIDVMWVAYQEGIQDQGGPKAQELMLIVAKAIEKYS